MMNIATLIRNQIKNHNILLYMKGTPEKPLCGFSKEAVAILKACQVKFTTINVLSPEIRSTLKQISKWPTFPQLYIQGEFQGGCDAMIVSYKNGSLQQKLNITTRGNDEPS